MSAPIVIQAITREEWLAERQNYLGGTDVAAIVGKSKWKTPLDVFLEKTGQKKDVVAARKAEAGLVLEPLIRGWYAEEIGKPIAPGRTIRDPQCPFLGVNTDGHIDEQTLCEIKTVDFSTKKEWGTPGTDEVPDHIYVQCCWQIGMAGAKKAVIVRCDRGTMELDEYVVDEDTANFGLLRAMAIPFWQDHIATRIPPALTEADADNVIHLFPEDTGEVLISDPGLDELAERMSEVHRALKPLEKEYESLKDRMKVAIGPAAGIETVLGTFLLQRMKGRAAWMKIAKALNPSPELIEKHTGDPYVQLKTPF